MIDAKKVDLTLKQYFWEAFKHIWGHQILYIFTLVLFVFFGSLINFLPRFLTFPFGVLVGSYFFFLLMEITFSSTQESYNPKKYIASLYVAFVHLRNFTRKHIAQVILYVAILLACTFAFNYSNWNESTAIKDASFSFNWLIFAIVKPLPNFMLMMFFTSKYSRYWVGDEFVLSRFVGLGEVDNSLLEKAFNLNVDFIKTSALGLFAFSMLFPAIFILAIPVCAFIAVTSTLYSMDVFDVDRFKKVRQQQEDAEKKSLPVPELS